MDPNKYYIKVQKYDIGIYTVITWPCSNTTSNFIDWQRNGPYIINTDSKDDPLNFIDFSCALLSQGKRFEYKILYTVKCGFIFPPYLCVLLTL